LKMPFNTRETDPAADSQPEEKKENFFVEMKKLLEQYIQDRILLFKLEMSKKAASTTASIVNGVAVGLFALFALIFLSVTLGFVFSELTGSFIWGFAIVAGIYILLTVIMIVAKKWVTRKVSDAVISSIYSRKKEQKLKHDGSHVSQN
ncbi:MAG TPA: phage holin family protein, partial [Chitinophagaceae bacterium]